MGLIDTLFGIVFGGNRNVVKETVEVFRENAEAGAEREAHVQMQALSQFATEFSRSDRSAFDQFIDGINRIPRPAMALGTLGLFVAAMVDPVWFASRMEGITLVPEPLWWLLGAIVSFYFGARHQQKGQEFQRSVADIVSRAEALRQSERAGMPPETPGDMTPVSSTWSDNAALRDWAATTSKLA